jgi:hypothetical protein
VCMSAPSEPFGRDERNDEIGEQPGRKTEPQKHIERHGEASCETALELAATCVKLRCRMRWKVVKCA